LDGAVDLENELGQLALGSREQATIEPSRAPARTAVIEAINIIQWALYYPGVLDLDELPLAEDQRDELADSLLAYRNGDLLAAVSKYPVGRVPASDGERVYLAALLMVVGQVEQSESLLQMVARQEGPQQRAARLANALRMTIAAVKGHKFDNRESEGLSNLNSQLPAKTATEWMAESYSHQSRSDLSNALFAARQAAERDLNFGFAWVRVAELEFSFGRAGAALAALDKGLRLSPRNAQALALKGYLLAARNQTAQAIEWFDQAIGVDNALGYAWLGRGLCRIRRGQLEEGRLDLQTAAALEPQRAVFRSYLGKAFSLVRDTNNTRRELERAQNLDPDDPTAWLYSALFNQQLGRINEAVDALEKSTELNDNRRLFRSRLLLDQDRAVRGANLASIYQDAGMFDVSVREATRAVNSDYASYPAHLFLANSYNALRDPRQINLRYETAWLSEFLVANLLAPVGSGTLSQQVSQQEYSRLLERDRLGLSSSTEYLSNGSWLQAGSQFGTFGNSAYAIDTLFRTDRGWRPNEDVEQLTVSPKFKQQLTAADSIYLQAIYYDFAAGDVAQYHDFARAHARLRIKESQEPILIGGYHREWSPGNHSLILFGRLQDTFEVTDPDQTALILSRSDSGQLRGVSVLPTRLTYRSEFEAYTAEWQQIWQRESNSLILGARYQNGDFDSRSQFERTAITADLERLSLYGYHHWRVTEPLLVTAGVSYDHLVFPLNFRHPPLSDREETKERVSPKAGLIWTPLPNTAVRAAYTRSLGGVSYDQSVRLEPSQVAGFNQAYRGLISESVVGATAASIFESWGVALDQRFPSDTYVSLEAERMTSEVDRTVGVLDAVGFPPRIVSAGTRQALEYEERNVTATVNQLIGRHWALGARYRWSQSQLASRFPEIPTGLSATAQTDQEARLHQINLYASLNHAKGFFGLAESAWFHQTNEGYSPESPGDDFWQFNLYVGYRFRQRTAEVRVGILNLADQDYRLNPLNLYPELPRERMFTASFRFNF
jgi:tetratricopeptide (TPR) repeat protein